MKWKLIKESRINAYTTIMKDKEYLLRIKELISDYNNALPQIKNGVKTGLVKSNMATRCLGFKLDEMCVYLYSKNMRDEDAKPNSILIFTTTDIPVIEITRSGDIELYNEIYGNAYTLRTWETFKNNFDELKSKLHDLIDKCIDAETVEQP